MTQTLHEIDGAYITSPAQFMRDVAEPCQPVIMRGLVGHWPVVEAAARSPTAFRDYVSQFDVGGQLDKTGGYGGQS